MCGETPKYIVVVNGDTVVIDASQTNYTLSETYGNKDVTWSVRAVVGVKEGPVSSCGATRVCLHEGLSPVVLSDPEAVSRTGNWTFVWTNPNSADGVCTKQESYTYSFALTNASTGVPVCDAVTSNTSVECRVNESGLYGLRVDVLYGSRGNASAEKNVSLCVPEAVEPPVITAPADGAVFLEGELVAIRWAGLTQKETQCRAPVSHYVRYWAEGEEAANATTLRVEDADTDVKLGDLARDTAYRWVLEETCEHWDRNLTRTGTFRTCSPSTPPVPVLKAGGEGLEEEECKNAFFGEQFTLKWTAVDFGEVCGPRNKTGYHVYFFPLGSNYSSVPYAYVEEPAYTVNGATDGDYQYVVRAVNNGVLGEVSRAVNVSVCVPSEPEPPVLLSPMKGAFLRIRDGVNFDIVKESVEWKVCGKQLKHPFSSFIHSIDTN